MDLQNLASAVEEIDVEHFDALINDALTHGTEPMEILAALSRGLEKVGERFEIGEYFLSELIVAGELVRKALAILKPELEANTEAARQHEIILGTMEGDMHDIGKEIIKSLLLAGGFRVQDLGVDVSVDTFANRAKETEIRIVGVSALLSTTVTKSKDLMEKLRTGGVRPRVIVGGGAVRNWMVARYGVDAVTNNAVEGLRIIKSWV